MTKILWNWDINSDKAIFMYSFILYTVFSAWWWPNIRSKHVALTKYIHDQCVDYHCIVTTRISYAVKSHSLGHLFLPKTALPKSTQVQYSASQSRFSNLRILLTTRITTNNQAHSRLHFSSILWVVSMIFHAEALTFLHRTMKYGGAVGWGTALQAGRSRVQFDSRRCHWNFSLTLLCHLFFC
jgi:hypothetical protein